MESYVGAEPESRKGAKGPECPGHLDTWTIEALNNPTLYEVT